MRTTPFRIVASILVAGASAAPTALAQAARAAPEPYSSGFITARDFAAGRLAARPSADAAGAVAPVACTPRPCVLPNVQASAGPQPVNEDAMAVNPAQPSNIITTGNDYNCASLQGIFATLDGGTTWHRSCMTPLRSFGGLGDIVPGFDSAGIATVVGIDSSDSGATGVVVFQRSTDGGLTWGAARRAVSNTLGGIADKPWLEVDTNATSPHKDSLYVSVTQFAGNSDSQITVSASHDGGATWTLAEASPRHTFPEVAQFSDLAIGRDGTLYLAYMVCAATGPTGDCGGTSARMLFQRSTDGGATWSAPVTMATVDLAADTCSAFYGCLPNTPERLSDIPVIAVDNSTGARSGRLYAAMVDARPTPLAVKVVSSADQGATWSAPRPVGPTGATADQFFPWLNVGPTGVLGVTWLDRRNDPRNVSYEAFATASTDGGRSFAAGLRLSSAPSNPSNDGFGGGFMGDYTGNGWAGTTLYMSYMDTRTGVAQDWLVGARR